MADILELVNGIFSNSVGIAWIGVLVSCILVLAVTKPVTWLSGMEPAAAGDVRFPMVVSVITMWSCRVALCIFFVRVFHFGLIAVWLGMFVDWTVRAVIFTARFVSGKWLPSQTE